MGRFAVVFAGGGCRAFWALGAFDVLRHRLPTVDEWAGVSAGSAMALASALGRSDTVAAEFCERTDRNPANFQPGRLFKGRRPFPHEEIYRATLAQGLGTRGLTELQSKAPVRILVAEVDGPFRTWRVLSATRSYQRRRKAGHVHGPDVPPTGVREVVLTAQELADNAAVVDAILASSASPPVTRVQPGARGPSYDGSLVDNVPVRALKTVDASEGSGDRVLVLLNRPMPSLPEPGTRMYLAPESPVPVHKWDYTNPTRIRETIAQGAREAEGWLSDVERWLRS